MPTYEYKCQACDHEFEEFQSITANALRKCPKCGKHKLKRLIGTGAGIIFKGSGFYETDYRSESYKKAAKAESDSASGKSESKSESKSGGDSAAKTDTPKSDAAASKPKVESAAKSSKKSGKSPSKD